MFGKKKKDTPKIPVPKGKKPEDLDRITDTLVDEDGNAYDPKENAVDKKVFQTKKKRWRMAYYCITIFSLIFNYFVLVWLNKHNLLDFDKKLCT